MTRVIKIIICLFLFTMLFITACNGTVPSGPATTLPEPVPEPDVTTTSPDTEPQIQQVIPDSRVEVVYFHTPSRCAKCLCFEERVIYVVNTYFKDQVADGTLTLTICDLSDGEKASLIRKYDAFASQLFVNTVVNNIDEIKNIEEIWDWHCLDDSQGFDAKLKDVIGQALGEIS
ncbi:MAG: nitrophenyl compound nitroreductase subunit ArsF family protein [Dehalococcoidia bacterium]